MTDRNGFVECPECKGRTVVNGKPCETCIGSGHITEGMLVDMQLADREHVAYIREPLATE